MKFLPWVGQKWLLFLIVRACRGGDERLEVGIQRYNVLFAIQGRRGECTRVKGVQQCGGHKGKRYVLMP
jgi:hypothetical protein